MTEEAFIRAIAGTTAVLVALIPVLEFLGKFERNLEALRRSSRAGRIRVLLALRLALKEMKREVLSFHPARPARAHDTPQE
jgi:hypothetical protein